MDFYRMREREREMRAASKKRGCEGKKKMKMNIEGNLRLMLRFWSLKKLPVYHHEKANFSRITRLFTPC